MKWNDSSEHPIEIRVLDPPFEFWFVSRKWLIQMRKWKENFARNQSWPLQKDKSAWGTTVNRLNIQSNGRIGVPGQGKEMKRKVGLKSVLHSVCDSFRGVLATNYAVAIRIIYLRQISACSSLLRLWLTWNKKERFALDKMGFVSYKYKFIVQITI